jgi:hypothetical protein
MHYYQLGVVVVLFPLDFPSSDIMNVVLIFLSLNCIAEIERKMSESEKRTSSSAELEEAGVHVPQAPSQLPNKVRFASNSQGLTHTMDQNLL